MPPVIPANCNCSTRLRPAGSVHDRTRPSPAQEQPGECRSRSARDMRSRRLKTQTKYLLKSRLLRIQVNILIMGTFDIYIYDDLNPEDTAMLQALYSRSSSSVKKHIEKVDRRGSGSFMKKYYVGYGHSSIADCGNTTLFIENVSIIACKSVQDNPLYSGQESSTRYIDFSEQPIVDPVGSNLSQRILKRWIDFYNQSFKPLRKTLKRENPLESDEDRKVWKKAIDARCFDILRGFLPAGVTTQLSWNTSLRQARDKIRKMHHHPVAEVREISERCHELLKDAYPSSFGHKQYEQQESYLESVSLRSNYLLPEEIDFSLLPFSYETTVDNEDLEAHDFSTISERPENTELPRYISQYGRYKCTFYIDYGSFRDLQRHRNGICRIPILDESLGFHDWYLKHLNDSLSKKANKLIENQYECISRVSEEHDLSRVERQYFYPLGMKIPCQIVYDLPEMVYVTEL